MRAGSCFNDCPPPRNDLPEAGATQETQTSRRRRQPARNASRQAQDRLQAWGIVLHDPLPVVEPRDGLDDAEADALRADGRRACRTRASSRAPSSPKAKGLVR